MKKIFTTTQSDLQKYNGCECEVVRECPENEYDKFDVGPMFVIRFADGYETDAFEDELCEKDFDGFRRAVKESFAD